MNDHSELLDKLYNLQNIGIKLGLDRVIKLFRKIGNPQDRLKFIHVAGTNGKGSVCSIIAKSLESAGYKVGFFSSPHLISLRERFRINGKGISWNELENIFEGIWPIILQMKKNNEHITFFEATVAIAALFFSKNNCDFVLWETGLGGRLDGTNIVNPVITAITGIGLDHTDILGNTEEKIAAEKGGIVKEKVPIFLGEMSKEAFSVIQKISVKKNAPLYSVKDVELIVTRGKSDTCLLPGWYFSSTELSKQYFFPFVANVQNKNLKLAYLIIKYLSDKYNFNLTLALKGIENLKWPGRIQVLPDGKILDGAHNPQGIKVFVETIKECFPNQKFKTIFGCMADKEPIESIISLKEITSEFIFTPIDSSRQCFDPKEILNMVSKDISDIAYKIVKNSEEALKYAGKSNTVIAGSLYLAGEILKKYYSDDDIVEI